MQAHDIDPLDYRTPATEQADAELRRLHCERARHDPAAFCSYVLKDEETGGPIRMQPMHYEWHALCSSWPRVVIWGAVESGKTHQISVGRVLWELGRNPNLRIVILSNTDGQAQKIAGLLAKYISSDPDLHEVFPELKPGKKQAWTNHTLVVSRTSLAKDPSVTTAGIHANITGARIDLLVVDDILDYENSRTQHARDDLDQWLKSTVGGRLTRRSRVFCVGNVWHNDDQLHRWARNTKVWMAVKYPIIQDDAKGGPPKLLQPDRWPLERVQAFEDEYGPVETARQLKCVARDDSSAKFKEAWIDRCLDRGVGLELIEGLEFVPNGYKVFTGVDLSTGKPQGHRTVLFTFLLHPNEDREVLDIEAGRWEGPEIVNRIIDCHYRFHSFVIVENVAAQEYILQFTRERSAVPVEPFTTNKNAFRNPSFGVESMGAEMANGKWIIPSSSGRLVEPEVAVWIKEMLDYDPDRHPGDSLMASYFAREGARRRRPKGRSGHLDTVSR